MIYLRAIDRENPISDTMIEQIWRCATEKHEDIMRTTLELVSKVIEYLPMGKLELVYSLLKMMPES